MTPLEEAREALAPSAEIKSPEALERDVVTLAGAIADARERASKSTARIAGEISDLMTSGVTYTAHSLDTRTERVEHGNIYSCAEALRSSSARNWTKKKNLKIFLANYVRIT